MRWIAPPVAARPYLPGWRGVLHRCGSKVHFKLRLPRKCGIAMMNNCHHVATIAPFWGNPLDHAATPRPLSPASDRAVSPAGYRAMVRTLLTFALAIALGLLMLPRFAIGQSLCGGDWHAGGAYPSTDNGVTALAFWDPDGPGPLTPVLAVGGGFSIAGEVFATNIATWNPQSRRWSALGNGVNGVVRCIIGMPNGELVVGGDFTSAGGQAANHIARWDGTSWMPLETGMDGRVLTLAVLPTGDLIAGGEFVTAGGITVSGVARWDGTAWSSLDTGLASGVVALAVLPDGVLVAAGYFQSSSPEGPLNRIARWDGESWHPFGEGMNGRVAALAVLPNGSLVAGGLFYRAGELYTRNIAQWAAGDDHWTMLGEGSSYEISSLAVLGDGSVVAVVPLLGVFRLQGDLWSPLSAVSGQDAVYALAVDPDGILFKAGMSVTYSDRDTLSVASWNGATWDALSMGLDNYVSAIAELPNGDVVAGGDFIVADHRQVNHVARFEDGGWSALNTGLGTHVTAMAILHNGDLVAGTRNFVSGPVRDLSGVARWDGTHWSLLGGAISQNIQVSAFAVLPNGDLIVAGGFPSTAGVGLNRIARWTGSAWSALGAGLGTGIGDSVSALAVLPGGELVAAGDFTMAGGVSANHIALWNGELWTPLGAGLNGDVRALQVLPDGTLAAGGEFSRGPDVGGNVATWDGNAWNILGQGMNSTVTSLAALPNGDLVVGGYFTMAGGVPANRVARWNGSVWSPIGEGLSLGYRRIGWVSALKIHSDGDLLVGGNFLTAGSHVSAYFARYTFADCPPCPADFDQSGGVDGADVESFFLAWEAGQATADTNHDGAVDGDDVQVFFGVWEAGGC